MEGSWAKFFMARGTRLKDLTGLRCGRLIATQPMAKRRGGAVVWECLCDCGNIKYALAGNLTKGWPKSCGCLAPPPPPRNVKHGMVGHPLYKIWENMMARCNNRKNKDYPSYGGRGIDVCERWHNPANFVADMTPRPPKATLDRIDNSLGYSPSNCRWATPAEQGANKRNNKLFTINGKTLHQREWCRQYDIPVSTFVNRLRKGLEPLEALTLPSQRPRKIIK